MTLFHQHPVLTRAGVLMFLYLVCAPAWAQMMPAEPFAVVPDASHDTASVGAGDPVKTTVQKPAAAAVNPYLDTFLKLQRQNVLLAQLLEREKSLTAMVQNYKVMGVEYTPPKPELKMCQEIPMNFSCAVAYPERYGSFLPPPAPLPAVPIIPVAISADDLPQPVQRLSADAGVRDLMWTDITCLKDTCRAVITPDAGDSAARYAVKVGDTLPPGGTVQSISFTGVRITFGHDVIELKPAPTRPFDTSSVNL